MADVELATLTDDEVKTLARRYVTKEIFVTNNPESLRTAFGAIIMFSNWNEEFVEQIGALWEEYSKAGPRSINGLPFFTSCHILPAANLQQFIDYVAEMYEALGV